MPRNNKRFVLTVLLFLCVLLAFAQKRVVPVIGNGSYKSSNNLKNPQKDAIDMSEALRELGFEVISGVNKNKAETERLIDEFGIKLAKSRGVGVVYYTGFGFQLRGENFLVPSLAARRTIQDKAHRRQIPVQGRARRESRRRRDLF